MHLHLHSAYIIVGKIVTTKLNMYSQLSKDTCYLTCMLVYVSPTYFRRMFAYIGYLALNTTNYMSGEATTTRTTPMMLTTIFNRKWIKPMDGSAISSHCIPPMIHDAHWNSQVNTRANTLKHSYSESLSASRKLNSLWPSNLISTIPRFSSLHPIPSFSRSLITCMDIDGKKVEFANMGRTIQEPNRRLNCSSCRYKTVR